jgi:hypothetical protein
MEISLSWSDMVSHILRQILGIPTIAILLLSGFVLPFLKSWTADFGMGKSFDPERDIGSLDGKVILVTGGTILCLLHLRDETVRHTDQYQETPA